MTADKAVENNLEHTLEEIRLGSRKAFKVLFDEYYPRLYWFVNRYVLLPETADEIVKELFIDLWQKKEKIVIHSSLNAYLYASARNRSLNYLRLKKTHEKHLVINSIENEELTMYQSPLKTPSEQLEEKELAETVSEVVESLPGRTRLVFVLHRDDGLSYSEIAEVLEISVKTVENQMARAFRILRTKLKYLLPFVVALTSESLRNVI
jgi:RNA polymerase sigma-70 factor, ECF subfamily